MSAGLNMEPSPGTYRWRTSRREPWSAVRLLRENGAWVVLINGETLQGTGAHDDWVADPFLRFWWPMHAVTLAEYNRLVAAHQNARPGSLIASGDLRQADAGYRREE